MPGLNASNLPSSQAFIQPPMTCGSLSDGLHGSETVHEPFQPGYSCSQVGSMSPFSPRHPTINNPIRFR